MSLLQREFGDRKPGHGAPDAAAMPMACNLTKAAAQRIRVGLTGLAAIFLLVLVATAGMRPAVSLAAQDTHGEPLAVLGVAPGAGPTELARDAQPRPAVARPSRT